MLASSYISPKAAKGRPSMIQGRGLVAVAPIAKDELVAIKGGHIVDTATLNSLSERLRNSDVQIAAGFHLVALAEAEYEPVMLFIKPLVRAEHRLCRQHRAGGHARDRPR